MFLIMGLWVGTLFLFYPSHGNASGQNWDGTDLFPGVSGQFDVPDPSNPFGTVTTCDDIRRNDGKSISGGTAGWQAQGNLCYSGGGQSFCSVLTGNTFQCAGVDILDEADIEWRDFDISEDEDEETQKNYYGITTRDETRGRAGHDLALFMNAHGVCRKIDNTSAETNPLFMGVSTAEEWRTVHGVPEGGDPNGGYTLYADNPEVKAAMTVCCAPVVLEICGSAVRTGYAEVGEIASAWGGTGHGMVQCVGNNDWRTVGATGVCGGGGGGDPSNPSSPSGGYYNPNNGGEMTAEQFDSLSPDVQNALADQGYQPTGGTMSIETPSGTVLVESPEVIETNNQQALDDAQAAQEEAERKAEEERLAAIEQAERDRIAAEEAARNDDDDDDEDDCTGGGC